FAVLSIIRLRAEQLSYAEIAYFFAAIVLGLVAAVDIGDPAGNAALAALVLAAPALIDHPRVLRDNHRMELTIERVMPDSDELRAEVQLRIGARIVAMEILDLDYVREVTRVQVHVLR
ncbi:MAG: DUF4956 domain-containing protein, partial [Actinomycetota bacterium]|nr:DUF4956 domain-containing protein [Actinomycetota bacterium]